MQKWVQVSWHAVERLRSRFPEDARGEEASVRRLIAGEVVDAITSGRMAARMPRFAVERGMHQVDRRSRSRQRWRSVRYVWTLDERRLYVIDRTGHLTSVLTVIRPGVDDTGLDVDAA